MSSLEKTLACLLSGRSDGNMRFADLRRILLRTGFTERIRGSHFIYSRDGVTEIINLQEDSGGKADDVPPVVAGRGGSRV